MEYLKENAKLTINAPVSEKSTDFDIYLGNIDIHQVNSSLKLLAAQMASCKDGVLVEADRTMRSRRLTSFLRSRFDVRSDDLLKLNQLDAHKMKSNEMSIENSPIPAGTLHDVKASSITEKGDERDERHEKTQENIERETESSSSSTSSASSSNSDTDSVAELPPEPLLPSNIVYTYDSIDLSVSAEEKQMEAKVTCDLANSRTEFMNRLTNTFPDLFKDEIDVTEVPNHDVRLEIVTSGYYKRPFCYRLPEFYHTEAKEKVDKMLSQGILRASSSPYASPMVCAPKKDGTLRVCTDFRHLNDITIADRYVMPRIDDIKRSIRGRVFSTIDLREGFYQIPIQEPDIPKTAMSTPWGLFEYVRTPFGLKNAPATFQRFLNHVTHQLENTSVYIDDLIIYSNTVEEHFHHLFLLFERLSRFGLVINLEKSEFFVTKAKYLGVVFSSRGYHPDMEIIGPRLDQMPKPHDRKSMQKFLGLVNYVRQHIPNLAHLARPLYELVKKHTRFAWNNNHELAYHKLISRCKQGIPLSPLFHDLP